MYMKRFKLIFVVLIPSFFVSSAILAQVDPLLDNLRNVVPPSPNASSLGKFSEWPVSLYTGVPEINIPIYELKGRSMSVPISINYHAAGIRVGEIASWVGLGWALNAGGCISRTVQGLPDEDGYLSTASNYTNPNNTCGSGVISQSVWQAVETQAVQGQTDTQMDMYNLSVLGKSYRIYINAANDSAYTMPTSNIRITGNFLQNSLYTWSALLEDGTRLLFGGSTNYVESTTNSSMGGGVGSFISAWYLQSITTPTGETITFTYASTSIVQPTHTTQSDYIQYWTSGAGTSSGANQGFTNSSATQSLNSVNTISQLSVSTIESDLTRVYFIPADTLRLDLNGGVALSEIKVLSKINNKFVEDWLFNYTYSQAASGNPSTSVVYNNNRLKLMSLTRNPTDGTPAQLWSFGYNPTSLPSQVSYAQDYWGFYNGANNNVSMLPTIPLSSSDCTIYPGGYLGPFANSLTLGDFTGAGFFRPNHDPGSNRSANQTYMQAEMLNKITYPTGGYSVLNYEANSQQSVVPVVANTNTGLSLSLTGTSNPYTPSQSLQFTLAGPGYVNLTISSTISSGISNDFANPKVTAQITDAYGDLVINNSSGNFSQWINLFVAGTYTLTLSSNVPQSTLSGTSFSVNAAAFFSYPASQGTQTISQLLGGLRINNMQQFDGVSNTPINSKYYVYGAPTVISPVDPVNDFVTTQNSVVINQSNGATNYYTKITRNASTKYALGSIQGGTVGYGQVTTYYGYNGADGYTVSTFSPAIPLTAASTNFPYLPYDPYSWRGGLLTGEQTYNASGKIIKSAYNTYQFLPAFTISNFKCGWATMYSGEGNQNIVNSGITCPCYALTNEQVQHVSSTQVAYDVNTGDSLIATTKYYYDDPLNMQPTHTVAFNSKGDSVVTYTRTALELPAINTSIPLTTAATTALDTMIARNIVGQPVETERYVKSVLTYKALTNFKVQTSGLVLPDNTELQNAGYPIETRINFTGYDSYGNLRQQDKINDENHNYIYDYVSNYPIAEVINADSASIAYTSFEADGTGGWILGAGSADTTRGLTGSKSYIPSGGISKAGLNSANTYIVSYWTTNTASCTIAGTLSGYPVKGKSVTINGNAWTYYEHKVTGQSTISLTGSGNIDELRLYPVAAQMTTYTYSPLIGITSQCDVDNRVTYYEYDGFQRLKDIRDQDGNVIKTLKYHYIGQTN
jgi:YD repeat-containing protein